MKKSTAIALLALAFFLLRTANGIAADLPNDGRRPWIGITSTVDKDHSDIVCPIPYVEAVRQAGGLPVIVPPLDAEGIQSEYLHRLDGLVLIGGWDIPPAAYGEQPHPTTEEMPAIRWEWEPRLINTWLESEKPLLGICLGAQMTNVVTGGTLIQDIPSQVGKEVIHRDEKLVWHSVEIKPGTRPHAVLGVDELMVTSSHHQAAERIGQGLEVVARSDDGVVEAMEMPGVPWRLFLQWHPERMEKSHYDKIFGALVGACRQERRPASEVKSDQ